MTSLTGRRPAALRWLATAGLLLGLASGPAGAADFQLDNLKLEFGSFVMSIPKLEVKGTPLDREGFVAIVQNASESPATRLARLNAAEISAPTLTMEQTFGAQKQVTTYRNVRFNEISEGRIGRGSSSDASIKSVGAPTGPMTGELKGMRFEGFDLVQIAKVFGEKAAAGTDAPLQTVLARFEQDGFSFDLGEAGKMSSGKATMRQVKARQASEPLGELLARITVLGEEADKARRNLNSKEEPSVTEARDRKMLVAMLELFNAVDYGSGEVRDVVMALKPPPKPGAKAEALDMRFARVAFGEDTPEKTGFVLEGLAFEAGEAKGTLALLGYFGFSYEGVIKELRAALAAGSDIATLDFRKFIPKLGTVRMSGLQVQAPQEAKPGRPAAPPMQIGLGGFELKAADQINGIPTAMSLTLDKITFPVVESPSNPSAKDLIAMGYRNLDLSAKLDLAWQESSQQLAIRTLSLSGVNMLRLDATGTLGNIGKEVFSGDVALAQVALLGATAKTVEFKLQNLGLAEKLIENEARKSKRKVEDVRREYGMMASLGLAAILGPSEGAKTLANAVARFVAKPGTLTVQATAKAPTGLGLADVIALGDPTEIFGKIDIKANAE
jgi:hypothetical protein